MTDCSKETLKFSSCKSKKINVDFKGEHITSAAGILLLRAVDKKIKLSADIARGFTDSRRQTSCSNSLVSLIRQRIYGIVVISWERAGKNLRLRGLYPGCSLPPPSFITNLFRNSGIFD